MSARAHHALLFASAAASTAYRDFLLARSPSALWMLGETSGNWLDESGNGRHLTPAGGVFRGEPSIIPSAGTFSARGNASYVGGGSMTVWPAGNTALTICAAIKLAALPASGVAYGICHQGNSRINGAQGMGLAVEVGPSLALSTYAGGGWRKISSVALGLAVAVPALVAMEHDPVADTVIFYVNGSVASSAAYSLGLGIADTNFNVGRLFDSDLPGIHWLNGSMQGVCVLGSLLGATDQLALAVAGGFA